MLKQVSIAKQFRVVSLIALSSVFTTLSALCHLQVLLDCLYLLLITKVLRAFSLLSSSVNARKECLCFVRIVPQKWHFSSANCIHFNPLNLCFRVAVSTPHFLIRLLCSTRKNVLFQPLVCLYCIFIYSKCNILQRYHICLTRSCFHKTVLSDIHDMFSLIL